MEPSNVKDFVILDRCLHKKRERNFETILLTFAYVKEVGVAFVTSVASTICINGPRNGYIVAYATYSGLIYNLNY